MLQHKFLPLIPWDLSMRQKPRSYLEYRDWSQSRCSATCRCVKSRSSRKSRIRSSITSPADHHTSGQCVLLTFWTICPIIIKGVVALPDYEELYYSLFRATEKAISILIDAQRKAEETILSDETQAIIRLTAQENANTKRENDQSEKETGEFNDRKYQ